MIGREQPTLPVTVAIGGCSSVPPNFGEGLNIISCPSCSRVENEAFIALAQHVNLDDAAFAREVEADPGVRPAWAAGGFSDLDESVRRSVAALRTEPALPHRDRLRGAVVDLATGVVREVGAAA